MAAVTQRMYAYRVKWWPIIRSFTINGEIYPLLNLLNKGVYLWYAILRICLLINIISLIPNIVHQNIILYAMPFLWLSIFFIIKKSE